MNLLKVIFCRHKDLQFLGNIYGDLIDHCGGNRSAWKCRRCGWVVYKRELNKKSNYSYNFYLTHGKKGRF